MRNTLLKNGKAAGPDDIAPELLKFCRGASKRSIAQDFGHSMVYKQSKAREHVITVADANQYNCSQSQAKFLLMIFSCFSRPDTAFVDQGQTAAAIRIHSCTVNYAWTLSWPQGCWRNFIARSIDLFMSHTLI